MSLLDQIYAGLPPLLQDLAVTAQGAIYRSQRFSGAFAQEHQLLRAAENASALQLELLQLRRLRRMLSHAGQNVPYYQSRIPPQSGNAIRAGDWSWFQQLPITEKSAVRRSPTAFLDGGKPKRGWIRWNTSGTTGTPMSVYYTREAVSRQYAFVERYREQAGVNRFLRRAQFTGRLIAPGDQRQRYWRYDWVNRTLLLSTVHLSQATIPEYLAAIDEYAPAYLTGYPSAIAPLAQYGISNPKIRIHIPVVLTSAETLLPPQREVIERGLGAKVFDQYGQTEMQSFWFECRYQRMHAHPLFGVTEILRPDGSPCAPGESGDVVLTGFLNSAMPLIRYRVGDRATWSEEDCCPCGRNLPIIQSIEGRREDYIYSAQRGWIGRMDPALKGVSGLLECQFVQSQPDTLRVVCVAGPEFGEIDRLCLEKNLHDRLGAKMRIEFEFVDRIPRGANGKFRAVISNLPPEFQPSGTEKEVA